MDANGDLMADALSDWGRQAPAPTGSQPGTARRAVI
jgi:hypothetical protein